jgi:hypothetical protein
VSPTEVRSGRARVASRVWRYPTFGWENLPDAGPVGDEVLIGVRRVGVCGSDTHCLERDADGYMIFSGPTRCPVVAGHEYAGQVLAVGPEVRHLAPGDLVAAEGMLYCGVCEACRRGLPNQCPDLEMVGFSSPGAYAERILARERFCWSVNSIAERLGSAEAALDVAALVEPIACPFNGMFVSAGGFLPGAHVVVYGCGPIGLGAILLARAAGAATVLAFDVSPERCALARKMGADQVWDLGSLQADGLRPSDRVLEVTRGWGADMQVEAAGAALQTMPDIERCFAPAGRMVYLGRTGQRAPVFLDALVTGASGIVGARGHAGGGCFPAILRLIESGRLDPAPMITARFPFPETLLALERSRTRADGKIMIELP